MAVNQFVWYNAQVKQVFSPDEVRWLTQKSNLLGAWQFVYTWAWIGFALALPAWYWHPITLFISIWILGGKQLACAIILHDAAHYALFTGKRANVFWGNVLGAYPILHTVQQYRPYHLAHHQATGTPEDPDILLTRGYPTTQKSMLRKFARDLVGITGIKALVGLLAMHAGLLTYNLGNRIQRQYPSVGQSVKMFLRNMAGPVAFHLIFFTILWAVEKPELYALWWAATLFTYPVCIRVRSIAEHSMVPDALNPQVNTRTVRANWFERLLFAPLHVNYHVEHHLLMGVPSYKFPQMHRWLNERGFYKQALWAPGYWQVLKRTWQKLEPS